VNSNPFPLIANDVMTSPVVTAMADARVRDVARILLEKAIGAVPVLDVGDVPVGMASDGDLLARRPDDRRRDWWLEMLAKGSFPADLSDSRTNRSIREVMTSPLISVSPDTPVGTVARILQTHRIKRVPVVRDSKIVGIVSRADLLGLIANRSEALLDKAVSGRRLVSFLESLIGGASLTGAHQESAASPPRAVISSPPHKFSAELLRSEVRAFKQESVDSAEATRRAAALERKRRVKALLEQHLSAELWREILDHAELSATHGEKEFLLLRFPSDLCADGGRMIDIAESGWESTLRGEAAEIYTKWRDQLRPAGFGMSACIVSYDDDGIIGDVGLYLTWGE
jgi:CBS domain-containing protein